MQNDENPKDLSSYNVHLYREMRLRFDNIKADSQEAAAEIARGKFLKDANEFAECDGRDLTAIVDVAGDKDYRNSKTIHFEDGRTLDAFPNLLAAARLVVDTSENGDLEGAMKSLRSAIAQAEGTPHQHNEPAQEKGFTEREGARRTERGGREVA